MPRSVTPARLWTYVAAVVYVERCVGSFGGGAVLLHDVSYADDDDGRGDHYLGPLLYMAAAAFWVKGI